MLTHEQNLFYKACLYVFMGNSMIKKPTKTILRLFTLCELQRSHIWKSNTLLLGLKGGKKPFIFDLYKIIIFTCFAI